MNNLKIKFSIALILVLFGCVKPERNKPEPFIEEQKMKEVLVDIFILEGKIGFHRLLPDSSFTVYRALENKVLWEKHGVKKKDFIKNHEYYMLEADIYDELMTKVVDSLGVIESEIISQTHPDHKRKK